MNASIATFLTALGSVGACLALSLALAEGASVPDQPVVQLERVVIEGQRARVEQLPRVVVEVRRERSDDLATRITVAQASQALVK